MRRKILINLTVFFLLIIPMVIYYRYDTNRKKKIIELLNKEYQSIKIDDQVVGKVSKIYHPYPELFNNDPHQAYVLINDSSKMRVKTGDEFNTTLSLDSILGLGDSLFKKQGSDTLIISHFHGVDTLRYKFQLRDDSGYPFRRKD